MTLSEIISQGVNGGLCLFMLAAASSGSERRQPLMTRQCARRLINPIFSHSIITEPGLSYLATGGGVAPALSSAWLCTIYCASQQDAEARVQADLSPARYQACATLHAGLQGLQQIAIFTGYDKGNVALCSNP